VQIDFYHVGAGTFLLRVDQQLKIGCDPVLNPAGTAYDFKLFKSTRVKDPVYDPVELQDVDLWLITHNHADHIDPPGCEAISSEATVILQKHALPMFKSRKSGQTLALEWKEALTVERDGYRLKIEALPAFHGSRWWMRLLVGRVNGYYLTISREQKESFSVYITADTVYHPALKAALRKRRVNLMVANMGEVLKGVWGAPLTLSPAMLKRMDREIGPEQVIPIHYDDFSHYRTDPQILAQEGFPVLPRGEWVRVA